MGICLPESVLREAWAVYFDCEKNISEAADRLRIPRSTLQSRMTRAVEVLGPSVKKPPAGGRVKARHSIVQPLPKKGKIKYYLLTCAQSNTYVNKEFFKNLLAFRDYYKATLLISAFTYDKDSYSSRSVKPGTKEEPEEEIWYDNRIEEYLFNDRTQVAPHLIFCAEQNTIPTAVEPLSGTEAYTGRDSSIFPHPALAMRSIASSKAEATKLNYTTGCVTLRNYIQKKAGLRAEHEHTYGALLVSVRDNGSWYVRQLIGGPDNEIYDLNLLAERGRIYENNEIAALTPGDIHADEIDETAADLIFGPGGVVDTLRPKEIHLHDILNFQRRSHHTRRNSLEMIKVAFQGRRSVEQELNLTATFLKNIRRDFAQIYVIDSNHDRHLTRWIQEADWKADPDNAEIYLDLAKAFCVATRNKQKNFQPLAWAMRNLGAGETQNIHFLPQDGTHRICRDDQGGIECALHGDIAPNGARPSPHAFVRMGQKLNLAHTHAAGIYHGVYYAGTTSKLDLGYNQGPSNWSHSSILTYPNGTRAIITCWQGRWRAE